MRFLQKKVFWGMGLVSVLSVGAAVALMALTAGQRANHLTGAALAFSEDPTDEASRGAVSVKTIKPKYNPAFTFSVKEPATVVPYYLSELDAQVAGDIEVIRKAEGSSMVAGELLAKVAVPDLEQEVLLKEAIVKQRQTEMELAQESIQIAKAAQTAAENNIEVKKADVDVAEAIRNLRQKEFTRLRKLIDGSGTTQQVVDEHEQLYLASVAGVTRSKNDVLKARSDLAEAQAKLAAAKVDVKLKETLIEVARKDRDKAQTLAMYSQVKSKFDGQIKRRHVDPGSFVRIGEPVFTVERTDIITITMKVPDTYAPFVTPDTEAIIEMSEFPGQLIHGKVTRFSPSLLNKDNDHTRLVQVDLFNGTEAEYQEFMAREKAKKIPYDDLKEGPLPLFPRITGKTPGAEPLGLIPGTYGEMRLVFSKLPNVYLVPSNAIIREGGTPFIYLVKDGKVVRAQVVVEVDDQKLAKIKVIDKAGTEEVKRPLSGTEEIIFSNQGELTDGQPVNPIPVDWAPRD